ncbi:SDR family NAD(P)-dependent oxidoreductase [Neobacillus niacini]|uniref:SDR family NAD(P)-dependent oxidoreductase n=1 Tax=Neobacillus niacini TaxID=86668 RepID=UPI00203D2001|nr:SDR family NAD(P)-dependent oxidoreductase [Neobacillus niacini]MCM3691078.1 SDR family oxidoreductase [Neobacillus niacini]
MGILDGKQVLVTGGARGIGFEIAKKMAGEGAKVFVNDVKDEILDIAVTELLKAGFNAEGYKADITDEEAVAKMFHIIEKKGGLDVLVNNAGLSIRGVHALRTGTVEHDVKKVTEIGLMDWNGVLNINLTGTFLCTRAAVPLLKKSNNGRIINMSSRAGRAGGSVSDIAYVTTKAGIIGFTKQCAIELGAYGITANAIAPGVIMSEWLKDHWENLSNERQETLLNSIPLKRTGEPQEIANICVFLASDSSSYITGTTLDANGGSYLS